MTNVALNIAGLEPSLPRGTPMKDAIQRVTPVQLAQLLAALPAKQSTRLSIARMLGEFVIPDGPDTDAGFVEYRNLSELGGFDVSGPIALADIMARRRLWRVPCECVRLRSAGPALGGVRASGGGAVVT